MSAATDPTPTPSERGRAGGGRAPSRRVAVLLGLAASAALIGATRTLWVRASAPDLTGTAQQIDVLGADAAPAVLALGLVAAAASVATALSSRWVRRITGPVLILSGLAAGWSALGAWRDPQDAAGSAVAGATGVVGGTIDAAATPWALVALLPALAVVAVGVLVLAVGRRWPVGTRYRSPAVAATADPSADPAAAWDALTRGEDPSLEDPADDPADDPDEDPGAEHTPSSR
ncbi:Trp biosynthesis-associated membrane protein [Brachybacterium sp. YJGR34]|uniref:Trp biosynthesis-associated membrane protein n=1 Tax=Brachybacterium sp. YJGR34 TaxID=2059911 RepID=UPI000E0B7038|nr:Trp biosynthesis-associated membrane protein [Brachybacterium sp. YJGR34]